MARWRGLRRAGDGAAMIEFKASVMDYYDLLGILVSEKDANGNRTHIAKPVDFEFVPHEPHKLITRGTIQLEIEQGKALMTALWDAGVRPHGIGDKSSEIRRIENHLEDMRKLVFK